MRIFELYDTSAIFLADFKQKNGAETKQANWNVQRYHNLIDWSQGGAPNIRMSLSCLLFDNMMASRVSLEIELQIFGTTYRAKLAHYLAPVASNCKMKNNEVTF